jgi:putative oxidoreductase
MNIKSGHPQSGAALLRITLGLILLAHGLLKVLVFGFNGTVGFFESIGLTAAIAYLTIFGEIAGGLGLITGIYSRLAAILSIPILLGASWAHIGNGWVFSNPGGGWEYPVLLVVLAVIVAIQGSGHYATGQDTDAL